MTTSATQDFVIGYPVCQVTTAVDHHPYPPVSARSNNNQPPSTPALNNNPDLKTCTRVAVLAIFVIICSIMFIYVIYRTATHPWGNPNFKVESATVTGINATGSEFTATWDITLLATSPYNKYTLSFDTLKAWVVYGDRHHSRVELDRKDLHPFVVNKRNQTRINMKLATVSYWVGDDVGKEIYDDQSRGLVSFGVHVSGHFRLHPRHHIYFVPYVSFQVNCDHVYFGISHNGMGKLMEQKKCKVRRPAERDAVTH